jgi:hypothetical protein
VIASRYDNKIYTLPLPNHATSIMSSYTETANTYQWLQVTYVHMKCSGEDVDRGRGARTLSIGIQNYKNIVSYTINFLKI